MKMAMGGGGEAFLRPVDVHAKRTEIETTPSPKEVIMSNDEKIFLTKFAKSSG